MTFYDDVEDDCETAVRKRRGRRSLAHDLKGVPTAFVDSINRARIERGLEPLDIDGIPDERCTPEQRKHNEHCRLQERVRLLQLEAKAVSLRMRGQ